MVMDVTKRIPPAPEEVYLVIALGWFVEKMLGCDHWFRGGASNEDTLTEETDHEEVRVFSGRNMTLG
jgi:hypothetical protein